LAGGSLTERKVDKSMIGSKVAIPYLYEAGVVEYIDEMFNKLVIRLTVCGDIIREPLDKVKFMGGKVTPLP
jgi:hypothetical protein